MGDGSKASWNVKNLRCYCVGTPKNLEDGSILKHGNNNMVDKSNHVLELCLIRSPMKSSLNCFYDFIFYYHSIVVEIRTKTKQAEIQDANCSEMRPKMPLTCRLRLCLCESHFEAPFICVNAVQKFWFHLINKTWKTSKVKGKKDGTKFITAQCI